jgi:mRNA-degrading endonuclease toxin of MazEF toxin-antitoxin module
MSINFTKYKRGSIWFYKEPQWVEKTKGVQGYSRPCLIISNDVFNSYSPVVNVVMLTTNLEKNSQNHINIYKNGCNSRLRDSTILIEQIKTVPIANLGEYFGVLSDELMQEVEKQIMIHLGIKNNTSQNLIDELKNIIEQYREMLDNNNEANQNLFVNELKDNIDSFIKNRTSTNIPTNIPEVVNKQQELTDNIKQITDIEKPIEEAVEKIKKKRGKREKWTKEDIEFFINNYDNKELLMSKYNLTKPQIAKTYYYVKNKVAND